MTRQRTSDEGHVRADEELHGPVIDERPFHADREIPAANKTVRKVNCVAIALTQTEREKNSIRDIGLLRFHLLAFGFGVGNCASTSFHQECKRFRNSTVFSGIFSDTSFFSLSSARRLYSSTCRS